MAQAKTLSQAELDQVLNYVSTKKYALRDRAIPEDQLTSLRTSVRLPLLARVTGC